MRHSQQTYVGLDDDHYGGMTPTGTIVREARLFGIIAEDETCKGWSKDRMQELYDKVTAAWEPYGRMVSNLPEELRQRHEKIFAAAIERAKALGWSPELDDDD